MTIVMNYSSSFDLISSSFITSSTTVLDTGWLHIRKGIIRSLREQTADVHIHNSSSLPSSLSYEENTKRIKMNVKD